MLLDPISGKLRLLDRQRDEAWIAGPGIGDGEDTPTGTVGWIDENNVLVSERGQRLFPSV